MKIKRMTRRYGLSVSEALKQIKILLNYVDANDERYNISDKAKQYAIDILDKGRYCREILIINDSIDNIPVAFCGFLEDKKKDLKELSANNIIESFPYSLYINFLASFKKGAGIQLLKDVLQLGEMEGVPVWLMSSTEAMGMYRRAGMIEMKGNGFIQFPRKVLLKNSNILSSKDWYFNDKWLKAI